MDGTPLIGCGDSKRAVVGGIRSESAEKFSSNFIAFFFFNSRTDKNPPQLEAHSSFCYVWFSS